MTVTQTISRIQLLVETRVVSWNYIQQRDNGHKIDKIASLHGAKIENRRQRRRTEPLNEHEMFRVSSVYVDM